MYGWRITKYDSRCRDERGAYLKDEWTSISDIGTVYEGKEFTYEDYRKVEDAYVSTALRFVSDAGLKSLKVVSLEGPHSLSERKTDSRDIAFDPKDVKAGVIASDKVLEGICRLTLREIIWCRLESRGRFYIHFGYDYYLYVGSLLSSEQAVVYGKQRGLFIEEMKSPYL